MRLFVALEVPDPVKVVVKRSVARWEQRLPPARWVRPESLHLTLAFLGETGRERLPVLHEALMRACGKVSPFSLRVEGGGTFPPKRPARSAWLGVREIPRASPPPAGDRRRQPLPPGDGSEGRLVCLAKGIQEALREAVGYQPDPRPYRPHLTLARSKKPWPRRAVEHFRELSEGFGSEPFDVLSCVLMESTLTSSGARYRTVEEFSLGGEP